MLCININSSTRLQFKGWTCGVIHGLVDWTLIQVSHRQRIGTYFQFNVNSNHLLPSPDSFFRDYTLMLEDPRRRVLLPLPLPARAESASSRATTSFMSGRLSGSCRQQRS